MKRKMIISEDGSPTFYVEELNEHYHSTFGALSESSHIFIGAGLKEFSGSALNILELGLGTGLNALLTLRNKKAHQEIRYTGIEKYPLEKEEYSQLNYPVNEMERCAFMNIHECEWEKWAKIGTGFHIYKMCEDFRRANYPENQDLIYFDAFGPEVQPGLWESEIFERLYQSLKEGGILVTYSVKGIIRRRLQDCGFQIEKLPGPRGKRHILRAKK